MSMIQGVNHVAVTDSHLTMAGGHVNHIAVNVALNDTREHHPPISLWSRLLGQWLLGPPSNPPPPIAVSQPPSATPETTLRAPPPPVGERTCQAPPPPSRGSHDDIEIESLDRLDIDSQLSHSAGPIRMPYDIYVKQLYPRGHGYPCFNPKPWGDPVKLGDIGLLDGDRFNVLQNLYDLPESFTLGDPAPIIPTVHDPQIFQEGDTVSGGIDDCQNEMPEDHAGEMSFRCTQDEGAVLVATSPAELLAMRDYNPLREYLCKHAKRLFNFLQHLHRFPEGASLYVVTGTVMSASWAIAVHCQPMSASYNSLVLRRVSRGGTQPPTFSWTRRGNAQTAIRRYETGSNLDQCLFLRGFLMTPSTGFVKSRAQDKLGAGTLPEHSDSGGIKELRGVLGAAGKEKESTTASEAMEFGSKRTRNLVQSDCAPSVHPGVSFQSIPPKPDITHYPSHRINKALLDLTAAPFAITHDDDWRAHVAKAAGKSSNSIHAARCDGYDSLTVEFMQNLSTRAVINHDAVYIESDKQENSRRVDDLGKPSIAGPRKSTTQQRPFHRSLEFLLNPVNVGPSFEASPGSASNSESALALALPMGERQRHASFKEVQSDSERITSNAVDPGFDDNRKPIPTRACARCKALKVRCESHNVGEPCRRCYNGGHNCLIPRPKEPRVPPTRESLISQIQAQSKMVEELMGQLERAKQTNAASRAYSPVPSTSARTLVEESNEILVPPNTTTKAIGDWISKSRESTKALAAFVDPSLDAHEPAVRVPRPRRVPPKREHLILQIQSQAKQIELSMNQLESVQRSNSPTPSTSGMTMVDDSSNKGEGVVPENYAAIEKWIADTRENMQTLYSSLPLTDRTSVMEQGSEEDQMDVDSSDGEDVEESKTRESMRV